MTAAIDRVDRLFAHNARTIPRDVHLVLPDGTQQTYAETFERASIIAQAIVSAGVGEGERVMTFMGNCRELAELYIACGLAGVIAVPVNTLTTARELQSTFADCAPTALFLQPQFAERLSPELPIGSLRLKVFSEGALSGWSAYDTLVRETTPIAGAISGDSEAPCVMIYSSGTTGRPKGILLRHRAVIENAHMTNLVMRYQKDDCFLTMLPLFSSFGFCWDYLMAAEAGARTVILPRFDPATVAEAVERNKVTTLIGVPTMFARVFDASNIERRDVSSLRVMDVGGGPVSDRLKHDLKHVHGIEIVESYGLTEISPVASVQIPFEEHRPGCCGPALPGIEVKVVDEAGHELPPDAPGELCFRCSTFMIEYWNKPEETAKALRKGWLHSGDIGTVDRDGYIYIRDRVKDLIISNGNNVYPKEVENALCEHAAVQSAAVIGVPDEIRGEIVQAFVVLKPGGAVAEPELIEHCARLIGRQKLPRGVTFIGELPLTASGKIQRFQLREMLKQSAAKIQ